MVKFCQNLLQVVSHFVDFFVDVANASFQARQVCPINAAWIARSKAAAESADRAIAAGHPLSQNQNPFLDFMKLNVELRCQGVNSQDVAAAPGQFVKFVSCSRDTAESFLELLNYRWWCMAKVVFDNRLRSFCFPLNVVRMVVNVFVEASLCSCSSQTDCKAEDQSVGEFCDCWFHLNSSFRIWVLPLSFSVVDLAGRWKVLSQEVCRQFLGIVLPCGLSCLLVAGYGFVWGLWRFRHGQAGLCGVSTK